jgi:hypothetical protein
MVLGVGLQGQTVSGTITGSVTDASGAPVPSAKVEAVNVATGVSLSAGTNDAGVFTLLFLPVGQYRLTAEMKGFKKASLGPFALEVNQTARLNIPLEVGEVTQVLEVRDVAPILQTESTKTGDVLDAAKVTSIPLNGRNFASLTQLIPGAVTTNPSSMDTARRFQGGGSRPYVNGNREQSNNFTVEGIDTNDSIDNRIGYQPNVDALQEVNVITGNASAEFGNSAGANVVTALKSGTNEFHGSLFEFLRDEQFDANGFFGNRQRNPFRADGKQERRNFSRHIFGGTFGGPILRNKLFFFADYEGNREQSSGRAFASVLPAEVRTGDMTRFPVNPRDPQAGGALFPGKQIPQNRIVNPVALALFRNATLYPQPNSAGTGALGISNNFVGSSANAANNDQGDIKVDYNFSEKDRFSGTYTKGHYRAVGSQTVLPIFFAGGTDGPISFLTLNWNRSFSANMVNEARFGYSTLGIDDILTDPSGVLGESGNEKLGIPGGQPIVGASSVGIGDGFSGIGSAGTISTTQDTKFQVYNNLTLLRGRHSIKVGGNWIRYLQDRFYPGNNGVLGLFGYSTRYTGVSTADFLLDLLSNKGRGSLTDPWAHRHSRIGVFVQDDFKMTSNLTLNLGLRWEYTQPLFELNNRQANIDLVTGQLRLAGQNGNSRALYNPYYKQFMPRIGFAYTPGMFGRKVVVRAGYAITSFMEGTGANLRLPLNPPFFFESDVTYGATTPGSIRTGFTDVQPIGGGQQPVGQVRAWNPDLRPQFTQQWNFSTEYLVSNTMSVNVGYVGQRGTHLVNPREYNQPLPGTGPVSTWAPLNNRRPLFGVAPLITNISGTDSSATMDFHSLQISSRKRLAAGLQFITSYTFGKTLTDNLGYYGSGGIAGEGAYWQNAYDRRGNYGSSFFDVRHNFTFGGSYDLPLGRGRKFGADWNRFLDTAIGGWQIGTFWQMRTGFPVTIRGRDQTSQAVRGAVRANRISGDLSYADQTVDNWFGTGNVFCAAGVFDPACAYGDPAPGQFGTSGIGTERAPNFRNWDLSIAKQFRITESQSFDFRAEFFNVLNLVNWGPPGATINTATFGQITSQIGNPRNIQFSFKYRF